MPGTPVLRFIYLPILIDRKITWSGYASQFLLYLWGEMMEWSLAIAAKHCGNPNF